MWKILIFSSIFSLIVFSSVPSRKVYYMGGGGESEFKNSTLFDYSFASYQNIESRGWSANYLFDDTHYDSRILLNGVKEKGKPFTSKNALNMLDKIENDLKNPNSKDSQLLIIINTHGGLDKGKYKIATSDGEIEIMSQLKRIKNLAKEKGVKLGIIGSTCFSGNLIELGDDNTCVMSDSAPDASAFSDSTNLNSSLINDPNIKNLEELHLNSRYSRQFFFSQPLISTSEGKKAFSYFKSLVGTISSYFSIPYVNKEACDSKEILLALKRLKEFASTLHQKLLRDFFKDSIKNIEEAIHNIQSYKKKYGNKIDKLFQIDCVNVKTKNSNNQSCFTTPSEFLSYKSELEKDLLKYQGLYSDPNNDAKDRGLYAARIGILKLNISLVEQVEKTDKFKKKMKLENSLPVELKNKLESLSSTIGRIENNLYYELYNYYKDQNAQPNACNQFKL